MSNTDLGSKATDAFDYGNKVTDVKGEHTHTWGSAMRKSGGGDQAVGSNLANTFGTTSTAGHHGHTVAIGPHAHHVRIGAHSHAITLDAAGNIENTVDKIAFYYIVRLT